jgi:hypothetical protein
MQEYPWFNEVTAVLKNIVGSTGEERKQHREILRGLWLKYPFESYHEGHYKFIEKAVNVLQEYKYYRNNEYREKVNCEVERNMLEFRELYWAVYDSMCNEDHKYVDENCLMYSVHWHGLSRRIKRPIISNL